MATSQGQATPELTYPYLKLRKDFGRQPQFVEDHAKINVDIVPERRQRKKIKRMVQVDKEVQAVPQMAEDEVNTVRAQFQNSGMYHNEGGWPKDVNTDDPEIVARFRKKLEKDENFSNAMVHMSKTMEKFIKQNNAMDIYGDFFKNPWKDADVHRSPPSANVVQVYRDPCPIRRSVSRIAWAPGNVGRFGVAHCPFEFDPKLRETPTEAFLWNLENSNRPESLIRNVSHICDMRYNPKDPFSIIGGCFNGKVCTWDTRAGVNPQLTSSYEISHRDLCKNVLWTNSKTGNDFFSGGLDGQIIWWDNRNLGQVVEATWLDPEKGNCRPEMAEGCSVLEYESTLPTKFMAGTENGNVMILMRKTKSPSEKLNHIYKNAHHGPIRGLQRNPVFIKNFLTVGDYTCRIFAEDCKESSILWTAPTNTYYTHGMWIPTRASSWVCSRMDGYCDFWDMLMDPVRPNLKVKVSDEMLTCLSPSENGKFVAVGTDGGIVCLLKLADSMTTSEKNDKPALAAIFERESRREKFLEQRNREIRLKKRDKEKAEAAKKHDFEEGVQVPEEGGEKSQMSSRPASQVSQLSSRPTSSRQKQPKESPVPKDTKYDAEVDLNEDPIAIAEREFFVQIQNELDERGVNAFMEKQEELDKLMQKLDVEGEVRDTSGSLEITEEELAAFAKIAKEEEQRVAAEEAEKLAREEEEDEQRKMRSKSISPKLQGSSSEAPTLQSEAEPTPEQPPRSLQSETQFGDDLSPSGSIFHQPLASQPSGSQVPEPKSNLDLTESSKSEISQSGSNDKTSEGGSEQSSESQTAPPKSGLNSGSMMTQGRSTIIDPLEDDERSSRRPSPKMKIVDDDEATKSKTGSNIGSFSTSRVTSSASGIVNREGEEEEAGVEHDDTEK